MKLSLADKYLSCSPAHSFSVTNKESVTRNLNSQSSFNAQISPPAFSLSALYGQLGILVCVESELNWSESTNSPTPPLSPPCLPGQGRELTGSITVARQRSVTSAHLHLPESLQLLSDETVIPRHVRSVPIKPSVVTLSPLAFFFFFFLEVLIDFFSFFPFYLWTYKQRGNRSVCCSNMSGYVLARDAE